MCDETHRSETATQQNLIAPSSNSTAIQPQICCKGSVVFSMQQQIATNVNISCRGAMLPVVLLYGNTQSDFPPAARLLFLPCCLPCGHPVATWKHSLSPTNSK